MSQADSSGNGFESRGLDLEVTRVKGVAVWMLIKTVYSTNEFFAVLLTVLNFTLFIANKRCS